MMIVKQAHSIPGSGASRHRLDVVSIQMHKKTHSDTEVTEWVRRSDYYKQLRSEVDCFFDIVGFDLVEFAKFFDGLVHV